MFHEVQELERVLDTEYGLGEGLNVEEEVLEITR